MKNQKKGKGNHVTPKPPNNHYGLLTTRHPSHPAHSLLLSPLSFHFPLSMVYFRNIQHSTGMFHTNNSPS